MTSEAAPAGAFPRLAAVAPLLALAAIACAGALLLAGWRERQALEGAGAAAAAAAMRLEAGIDSARSELGGYAALLEGQAVRRAAELAAPLAEAARRVGRLRGLVLLDGGGMPAAAAGRAGRAVLPATALPRPGSPAGLLVQGGELWLAQPVQGDAAGAGWVLAAMVERGRLADPGGARLGLVTEAGLVALGPDRVEVRRAPGEAAGFARGPGLLVEGEAFRAASGPAGARAVAEIPAGPLLERLGWQRRAVLTGAAVIVLLLLLAAVTLHGMPGSRQAAADRSTMPAALAGGGGAGFLHALPVTVYRGELFPDISFLPAAMSGNVEAMTGFTWQALAVPGSWRRRLDAEGRETLDGFYRRLLEEGEAAADYAFTRADGRQVWLRDHARIISMGAHDFAEVAGCLTDVSAERQLGEQAAAASKLATLGRMATSLAHELSQPLGAILLAAENGLAALDRTEPDTVAARKRLHRVAEQAERARQVVDHLRAFGRADAGELEAVPLAAALDGAMVLVGQPLEMAGIDLSLDLPPGLPPVKARRVLLEQVFVNLMLNARDAMLHRPDGGRRLHIVAEPGPRAGVVTLRIADTGPGFTPEVLRRLFEPFFTTKRRGEGTGLGLSICHGILGSFGASIAARNAGPPGGAVFELTLREALAQDGQPHQPIAATPWGMPRQQQEPVS